MGKAAAVQVLTLIQDDFEDGAEIRIIGGKTLPEDRQFKYEQAQGDVEKGLLSPVDYFEVAGYEAPAEKAKNRVVFDLNKPFAVGIPEEEMAKIAPKPQEDPPKLSISYMDLPPDGKVQLAAKAGIQLDPEIVIAEAIKDHAEKRADADKKNEIAERSVEIKSQPKPEKAAKKT